MANILEYLKINQAAYTVVGILLTLLFSIISLWFTVQNNKAVQYMDSVTKNRVEWISILRKNVSELIALLDTLDLTDGIADLDEVEKYPFSENLKKLNQLSGEIKLMLNFSDNFDREIMYQIDLIILEYKNLYLLSQSNILEHKKAGDKIFIPNNDITNKQYEITAASEKLLDNMQIYLKSEWNRVKYESKGKTYEKETQLFDLTELKEKKANPKYENNTWKRFCINSKAKCKRILHSHQFSIIVVIVVAIILILYIPEFVKDIKNLIEFIKSLK